MSRLAENILEGLAMAGGGQPLNESITSSVTNAVKTFLKDENAPTGVRTRINNVLNALYKHCNDIGNNEFTGGTLGRTKGTAREPRGGEIPLELDINPSLHECVFQVRFDRSVNLGDAYKTLAEKLKAQKKDYKEFDVDNYAITASIDVPLDALEGYYITIEKKTSYLRATVGHRISPLNEGAELPVSQIGSGLPGKSDGTYSVSFSLSNPDGRGTSLKITASSQALKATDYATWKPGDTEISSYGKEPKDFVNSALRALNYGITDLQSIYNDMRPTGISEAARKKAAKGDSEKADEPEEGSEGEFGDKEEQSDEATDISGIATPNNSSPAFGNGERKRLFIVCPKCQSRNVNVFDGTRFKCSSCGNVWMDTDYDSEEDEEAEEVDGMLDNSEDEPPLTSRRVTVSAF